MSVNLKNLALGQLAGVCSDVLIDVPLEAAGLLKALEFRDQNGIWVWGVGTGDVTNAVIGASMFKYGAYKGNTFLKDFGLGWLLALGFFKFAELVGYLYRYYKGKVGAVASERTLTDGGVGGSSCPVCGGEVEKKPFGIDVKCIYCGFVSAWSR